MPVDEATRSRSSARRAALERDDPDDDQFDLPTESFMYEDAPGDERDWFDD